MRGGPPTGRAPFSLSMTNVPRGQTTPGSPRPATNDGWRDGREKSISEPSHSLPDRPLRARRGGVNHRGEPAVARIWQECWQCRPNAARMDRDRSGVVNDYHYKSLNVTAMLRRCHSRATGLGFRFLCRKAWGFESPLSHFTLICHGCLTCVMVSLHTISDESPRFLSIPGEKEGRSWCRSDSSSEPPHRW